MRKAKLVMSKESTKEEVHTIGLRTRLLALNTIIQICRSKKNEKICPDLLDKLKACSSLLRSNGDSKVFQASLNENISRKSINAIDNNTETKISDTETYESLHELYHLNETLKKILHNYPAQ